MSLDLKTPAELARPVQGVDDLIAYLRGGEKPPSEWRIGVEHEKLGYLLPRGPSSVLEPVPYEGSRGIRALLEALARRLGGCSRLHSERGNPIALLAANGASISLEPGGQLELSGAPARGLLAVDEEVRAHLDVVRQESAPLGIVWLAGGYRPFGTREAMPWMPKLRYGAMRRSLGPRGALALDMMLMTATVQANLDWSDEVDLGEKVRAATSASPLVSALFANSPIARGADAPFLDLRYQVWRQTDPARCGLLEQMTRPDFSYRAYVEWALGVPLLFVRHEGEYLDGRGRTFGDWMRTGEVAGRAFPPTLSSWVDHLTTLFPEVRIKRVLELRGADVVPPPYLLALPALWLGLLYDREARRAAWELTARWTFAERLAFQEDVARRALAAEGPAGAGALALARELMALAREGLSRRAREAGIDDRAHLGPAEELAREGRTLAERTLSIYQAANRDPSSIIRAWAIA